MLFKKTLDVLVKYPQEKTAKIYEIPSGVKRIFGNAFFECTTLESIIIPDSVELLGSYAFHGCSNLEEIVLSSSISDIKEGTFINCRKLTTVTIPENVASIASDAFEGCSDLKEILINQEKDGVPGAPWGANSATVKWKGEF